MLPDCLLIADDLTGACDAAVQFALHGLGVIVSLGRTVPASPPEVLAISTDSRDARMGSFGKSLEAVSHLRPRIIFKKIDSTLRGNVGPEVVSAMAAFDCHAAVVTPAFPAMGRLVEQGRLRIEGENGFVPRDLSACFHGLDVTGIELRDATCDADLDDIVRETLGRQERVLWAGSAGLAAALARATGRGSPAPFTAMPGAPLFCLGSNHPVTMAQQDRLLRLRSATLLRATETTPAVVQDALARGPVVLRIDRGQAGIEPLLRGLYGPLVLCGGDTASLVCQVLEVQAIELRTEVAPGIPCGLLRGGPFDGAPLVTKSGGFGGPDALMQIADFFTCSPQSH